MPRVRFFNELFDKCIARKAFYSTIASTITQVVGSYGNGAKKNSAETNLIRKKSPSRKLVAILIHSVKTGVPVVLQKVDVVVREYSRCVFCSVPSCRDRSHEEVSYTTAYT